MPIEHMQPPQEARVRRDPKIHTWTERGVCTQCSRPITNHSSDCPTLTPEMRAQALAREREAWAKTPAGELQKKLMAVFPDLAINASKLEQSDILQITRELQAYSNAQLLMPKESNANAARLREDTKGKIMDVFASALLRKKAGKKE